LNQLKSLTSKGIHNCDEFYKSLTLRLRCLGDTRVPTLHRKGKHKISTLALKLIYQQFG